MKVRIIVTDDSGRVMEGEIELSSSPGPSRTRSAKRSRTPLVAGDSGAPDVNLPLRPYLRRYARGKSGAAKATLLIAHIAGGRPGVPVTSTDLLATWGRTTSFMGAFNRAHATRAKDNGWIDSPSHGVYVLLDSWAQASQGGAR
jgi:hypothetical protein